MSKLYRFKNRFYRYSEKQALLEFVWPEENMVVDSVGLSKLNWEEDKMYWIEKYHNELDEELAHMSI